MADASLTELSAAELGARIQAREVSPVEVTEAFLARIEATESRLNAFITRTPERALADAKQAEAEIAAGNSRGALHGVPLALKDLYWTAGIRTTSGSVVETDFVPDEDSTAAAKLRAAGTVLLGKTNMVEFAYGGTEHNEAYGAPQNPWRLGHITGGSSSGSGAAVAAGQAALALGTDTGGSIRIPAALCGISGHKPTYGLVSKFGVTPLGYSLDHVGPMARTVDDLALAMNVLAGYDPRDPASANRPTQDYVAGLAGGVGGLRIGVPWHYISEFLDPEVDDAFRSALAQLGELGATVEEIKVPELYWASLLGSPTTASDAASFHGDRIIERGSEYHPDIRRRIETGRFVPGSAYVTAQRMRARYASRLAEVFRDYDLIATPTAVLPAPLIGETVTEVGGKPVPPNMGMSVTGRMTQPFNVNGAPAVSVPAGFSQLGLPIGLQLVGKPWDDALVLRAAAAYQRATEWHTRRPEI